MGLFTKKSTAATNDELQALKDKVSSLTSTVESAIAEGSRRVAYLEWVASEAERKVVQYDLALSVAESKVAFYDSVITTAQEKVEWAEDAFELLSSSHNFTTQLLAGLGEVVGALTDKSEVDFDGAISDDTSAAIKSQMEHTKALTSAFHAKYNASEDEVKEALRAFFEAVVAAADSDETDETTSDESASDEALADWEQELLETSDTDTDTVVAASEGDHKE